MTEHKSLKIPLSIRESGECFNCTSRLMDDIKRLRGIKQVGVAVDPCQLLIEYDPNFTTIEIIENYIIRQGLKLKSHYDHKHYFIENLDCPDCALKLEQRISKIQGITWASLNFATSNIWFEYEPEEVTLDTIVSTIENAGYQYREPEVSKVATEISLSAFTLEGLDCPDCAAKLQKKLSKIEGIEEVVINFNASSMTVKHDISLVNRSDIIDTVGETGYTAIISEAGSKRLFTTDFFSIKNRRLLLTTLSGIFIFLGAVLPLFKLNIAFYANATGSYTLTLSHFFYLLAVLFGGYYAARSAYYSILAKSSDMNVLMTIAVLGALAIGQFEEGAMVTFLFALGNLLQSYTLDKARGALRLLMDLAPKEANVKKGGILRKVPVSELKVGDIIIVKPGEKIPIDGVVIKGDSFVNEAAITGESMPVDKTAGSQIFAGSVNGSGALEIRMEKGAEDSTLSHIIHLVEEAQAQKAPSQNFVEKFSKIYTPAVILGAVMIMVLPPLLWSLPFIDWFYRGLMLLVISCPCALVLSTPVSIVSALACSSRKGILIKGGAYLEEMANINAVAFDKTGTITRARPEVTDILPLTGGTAQDILGVAASLEVTSEHALAKAIIKKAKTDGSPYNEPKDFTSFPGKGIKARVNGEWGYIGNLVFFADQNLSVDCFVPEVQRLEAEGKTAILIQHGNLKGIISLADTVRKEAQTCVADLKKQGIKHIALISGDSERVVSAIATSIGIDEYHARMLPEDKVDVMRKLLVKYGKVSMVGDGINDAPALAASTVGIAMGVAGTDTALETSDITLMSDDLLKLPFLVHLSRRTLATIKTNIGFSMLVKAAFIALVFLGMANLWMAVASDTGTSLLVILNGMRLIRSK